MEPYEVKNNCAASTMYPFHDGVAKQLDDLLPNRGI